MRYEETIDAITLGMIAQDGGSAELVQHFLKVHRFAQLIGRKEQLEEHTQFVLECAALVHDIAIGPCREQYGYCTGTLQEQEGPAYARTLLESYGLAAEDVERICYLVGHHHTYNHIDGMDYQILVEADFLVNLHEQQTSMEAIEQTLKNIFKTQTGTMLCRIMFGIHQPQEEAIV